MFIYVVHEIEGGSILIAYTDYEDARGWLNWEEAIGNLLPRHYTISKVELK